MKLLLITLLFGACLSVQAGVDKTAAGKSEADIAAKVKVDVNAGEVVNSLEKGVEGTGEGALKAAEEAKSALGGVLGDVGNKLTQAGEGLIAGLKAGGNFVQTIVDFIKRIVEAIMGFVLRLLNAITAQIEKAEGALYRNAGIERTTKGFGGIIQQLRSQLRGLGDNVISGLGSVGAGLINTVSGKDFDGKSFTPDLTVGGTVKVEAGEGQHQGGHPHFGPGPAKIPGRETSGVEEGDAKPREE